jgi:replicative DNA helicase
MVNTGEMPHSEIDAVDEAMDMIYQMRLDTQMMLAMLPRFLEYQRTRRALNSRFTSADFTPEAVFNEISAIRTQVGMLEADDSVVVSVTNIRSALPSDESPPIPLGIDTLDSRLGGGVKRKKVVMICAYTGYGKSTLGLNIAWRNSEGRGIFYGSTGLRSVFATTELPREECLCRYYSMILSYPFELIWKGDSSGGRSKAEINDEVERMFYDRVRSDPTALRSSQNFKVWDYSTKKLTPDMLEQQVKVERAAGNPVDLLVLDYIDKMSLAATEANKTFRQDRRQELGEISKELERIAIEYNLLIVVLTQANDEGSHRASVRMTAPYPSGSVSVLRSRIAQTTSSASRSTRTGTARPSR